MWHGVINVTMICMNVLVFSLQSPCLFSDVFFHVPHEKPCRGFHQFGNLRTEMGGDEISGVPRYKIFAF